MIKYLLIYIFVIIKIFSSSIPENLVDGNMDIKINNIRENFFSLYIDEIKEKGYISLRDFFYIIELNRIVINIKDKKVSGLLPNGKEVNWIFNKNYSFIYEDDIYIDVKYLKEIVPIKLVKFNLDMLIITIILNFKTPLDIRNEQLDKRNNIFKAFGRDEENLSIITNKKIISSGIIQLEYLKFNLSKGENKVLNMKYSTQLLYGEFQGIYNLLDECNKKNENTFKNISLTYNNVFNNKDLILGDFYLRTPKIYSTENNVSGISLLNSSSRYSINQKDMNEIEGEAPSGSIVELYRNGILIDYQEVINSRYSFNNVQLVSLTDSYFIRIYNSLGEYIQKDLSILMNNKILKKGDWTYSIQRGHGKKEKKENLIGILKYGIYKNITGEIGYYNLQNRYKYKEYRDFSFGTYYSSPPIKFPVFLKLNWFQSVESEDGTLNWEFQQKLSNIQLDVIGEKYGKRISLEQNKNEYYKVNLKTNLDKFILGLSYEVENYKGDNCRTYSTGISYNKNYYSTGVSYSFLKHLKDLEKNRHIISCLLGVNCFEKISLSSYITNEYTNSFKFKDNKYSLRLSKRDLSYINQKYLDISLNLNYSSKERDHFRAEINGNVYLDKLNIPVTSAKLSFNGSDESHKSRNIGMEIKKNFILNDIFRNSKIENISNSWIKGRVYIDNNNNDKYDIDDVPMNDLEIYIQGKRVKTDKNGKYIMENISSNSKFKIKLDKTYIDPLLHYKENINYKLMPSTGMEVNIPLQYTVSLSGNIILKNKDIELLKLSNIYSKIEIKLLKNNKIIKISRPEYDGYFNIDNILKGEYELKIESENSKFIIKEKIKKIKIDSKEIDNGYIDLKDIILLKREDE